MMDEMRGGPAVEKRQTSKKDLILLPKGKKNSVISRTMRKRTIEGGNNQILVRRDHDRRG